MNSKPPEPPTRDEALALRRRTILEAAVVCFMTEGYHQTGVRDIARQAGVSLGNLYNHFPSKHDVLIEIAQLERAELERFAIRLRRPGPVLKRFERFVRAYAKYLSAPEQVILSIEITSEAIRKDDLAALFGDNRLILVNALAALLEQGVDQGVMRCHKHPQDTAAMILELIEGRAYHTVLSGDAMRKTIPGLLRFLTAAVVI